MFNFSFLNDSIIIYFNDKKILSFLFLIIINISKYFYNNGTEIFLYIVNMTINIFIF